ncbi:glutamate receptor-interacting protein 1-like isoform X3 [Lineus longissimus]|uniref:glutamate receptor-interacting protein 1-like isoform X3 n=1 Tax=Lineus longissimus TaxID=88925 RepID=UPI002B4CC8E3
MAALTRFRKYFAKKFIKLLGPNKKKKRDSEEELGQETSHVTDEDIEYRQADTLHRARVYDEDRRGVALVELHKKEGCGLGLTVIGGADKGDKPSIANIRPGGVAHRSDALQVGDAIMTVNGIRMGTMKHDEMINLLKNAKDKLVLEVEYDLPDLPSSSFSVMCKSVEILLEKEGNAFGFTMRGGLSSIPSKTRPLTVTQIRPGGSADREGSLKIGDRILAINGINVTDMRHDEAMTILRRTDSDAVLLVEYDVSIMEEVRNPYGPLMIEIGKNPGANLGITLTTTKFKDKTVICVENIREASIADRCGALHFGDQVLSIDGTSLEHMTLNEATQLLKSSVGELIKLEILPLSKIKPRQSIVTKKATVVPGSHGRNTSPSSSLQASQNSIPASISTLASRQNSYTHVDIEPTYARVNVPPPEPAYAQVNVQRPSSASSSYSNLSYTNPYGSLRFRTFGKPRKPSSDDIPEEDFPPPPPDVILEEDFPPPPPAVTSAITGLNNPVSHPETTEVTIFDEGRGFCFTLQGSHFSGEMLTESPIIDSIDPGGPAEKSGVIQEGDRLLSINGNYLEGRTLQDINTMLRESGKKCTLEIEFDVADAVVPSCGTFNVKVGRRGATLGITISGPKNRQPGDPLIISGIKKGSVAHRTGTLHAGDKLLAIDVLKTDNLSIEEAARVLTNVEDIVKLRIRKDEPTPVEDPAPDASAVSHVVELRRCGGPLGLTISGTEEPFDPIIISGLTENGLAERSGALNTGDRILAINGKTLKGRPLSDAIATLQSAGDIVTLLVSRVNDMSGGSYSGQVKQYERENYAQVEVKGTNVPVTSVDSALDSWDSAGLDSQNSRPRLRLSVSSSNTSSHYRIPSVPSRDSACSAESGEGHNDPWDSATASSGQSCRNSASTEHDDDNWIRTIEELEEDSDRLEAMELMKTSKTGLTLRTRPLAHSTLISSQITNIDDEPLPPPPPELQPPPTPPTQNSDEKGIYFPFSGIGKYKDVDIMRLQHQMQVMTQPTPTEILKVTLYKNSDSDNFGLSVSDGLLEKGVYISALRPGGPADKCGVLRNFDRILQVNHVKTRDLDCCLVVPLIAASGNQIDIVVSRNPVAECNEEDNQSVASSRASSRSSTSAASDPSRSSIYSDPRSSATSETLGKVYNKHL